MIYFLLSITVISYFLTLGIHLYINQKAQSDVESIIVQHQSKIIFGAASVFLASSIINSHVFGLQQINILSGLFNIDLAINLSLTSIIMFYLISFMATVIYKYSEHYLQGENTINSFFKHVSLCFFSISICVSSANLLTIGVFWFICSNNLLKTLSIYSERCRLVHEINKAKIFFRISELFFFSALLLLVMEFHTFDFNKIIKLYMQNNFIKSSNLIAAEVLLVLAIVVKTVQLPFHGWILKIMEAPTPLSAILHAGIINLGGYLLIAISPMIGKQASFILLIFSLPTTVISALAMGSQSTIKAKLSWSTCAQMGFMLLECALGVYQLAFIHLICHSLYKGHAFLYSGTIVEESQYTFKSFLRPNLLLGFILAFILVNCIETVIFGTDLIQHLLYVPHWILTFSIATILAYAIDNNGFKGTLTYLSLSSLLIMLFLLIDKSLVKYLSLEINTSVSLKSAVLLIIFASLFLINLETISQKLIKSYKLKKAIAKGFYFDEYLSSILFNRSLQNKLSK